MADQETGTALGAEVELTQSPGNNKNRYELIASEATAEKRVSADLTWVNLNFRVNGKSILTNCWGKVMFGLFFIQ